MNDIHFLKMPLKLLGGEIVLVVDGTSVNGTVLML